MIKIIHKLLKISTFHATLHIGVGFILLFCGLVTGSTVHGYEPQLPNNLLGYAKANDFKPNVIANIQTVLPNGVILLSIQFQAERATEMKVSLEPEFTYSAWQKYTPRITNWRVTPQSDLITLYAIFKRKNNPPELGSSISPIVHYTFDLNNGVRVLERTAYGYVDWTEQKLIVETVYRPSGTIESGLFEISRAEKQARGLLELDVLRAFERLPITPGFTIADLLYLEPNRRHQLIPYLSLLSLEDIDYGREVRDGRPYSTFGGKPESLTRTSPIPLQLPVLKDTINLFNHKIPSHIRLTATIPFLRHPRIFSENDSVFAQYPTLYEQFKPRLARSAPILLDAAPASRRYEGLVLDLRGTTYQPNLYPRVITTSGEVVLSSDLYKKTSAVGSKPSIQTGATAYEATASSPVPYVQYVRNLETAAFPATTLFVQPREVSTPLRDIIIEDVYGDLLSASREQIVGGAFWIVLD